MNARGNFMLKQIQAIIILAAVTTVAEGIQEWTKLHGQSKKFVADVVCSHDTCRNVTQLITNKGYPCEDHSVLTKDGYILGIQRIPHGRSSFHGTSRQTRPVVFLQHGFLAASTNWVTNLANESLGTPSTTAENAGFLLADAGFDVWLGNSRGNTYSRKHVSRSPLTDAFWAWSWDEMAEYDVPAVLEYVLTQTGQEDLYYIGHSQGTLIAFSALSRNQQLAKKVKLFIALGPVTSLAHVKSPIRFLSAFPDEVVYGILGRKDFLPNDWIIKLLDYSLCIDKVSRFVCDDVLFLLAGYDTHYLNQTRLPVYIAHCPAGTSMQDLVHFSQMMRNKKYQMYNYGTASLNKAHYGQTTPPLYNVTNMQTPVVLFYAGNDWLATVQDVKLLIPKIQNLKGSYEIKDWNHLDFVWAYDAKNVLYNQIIQMLKDDISQTGHTSSKSSKRLLF